MRDLATTPESEQSNQEDAKLLFKLIKKVLGVKTPDLDLILRVSDVANGDSTPGDAVLDTTLSCNGVTATVDILSKLGRYSAENNFSNRLANKSAQLISATNPIHQRESAELWQAFILLKILEDVAYGVTEIKHFIVEQINETFALASQALQVASLLKDAISIMMVSGKLPVNLQDANKKLFDAAKTNNQLTIEMALHFGADINAQDADWYGHSALQHAVERSHLETAIFLMDRGANPHQKNNNPIHAISARESASVLQAHAHIKRVHDFFETQDVDLLNQAFHGNIPGIERALQYGARISARNAHPSVKGYTALMHAAQSGSVEAVNYFIEKGEDIFAEDEMSHGKTALRLAVESGHLEVARHLMDLGANPLEKNRDELCARDCARIVYLRGSEKVKRVYDFFEAQDVDLLNQAYHGNIPGIERALKYGARISARNAHPSVKGYTALMHAAQSGRVEAMNYLIEQGAGVFAEDEMEYGKTALQLAVESGHLEIAQRLMDHGADPHQKNKNPIYPTSSRESASALQAHAHVKRVHDFFEAQDTTLLNAAYLGDLASIGVALKYGANINVKNPHPSCYGRNPLHHAVQAGRLEAVKLLVEQGADLEAIDGYCQFRPVHWAAEVGRLDIFNLLVSLGANPYVRNENNHSPYNIACIRHPAIALSFPIDPASRAAIANIFRHLSSSSLASGVDSQPNATPTSQPQSDRDRRLAIMNNRRAALTNKGSQAQVLFDAAKSGDCNGIRNAIASGIPINARDPYHGYTAIHWAVHYKRLGAYNLLCSIPGVDRNLPNADGFTPFALACELHSDIVFPVYIYAPQSEKDARRYKNPFHCSETPGSVAQHVASTSSNTSSISGGKREAHAAVHNAGFFGSSASHVPDPGVVAGIRAEIAAERAQEGGLHITVGPSSCWGETASRAFSRR